MLTLDGIWVKALGKWEMGIGDPASEISSAEGEWTHFNTKVHSLQSDGFRSKLDEALSGIPGALWAPIRYFRPVFADEESRPEGIDVEIFLKLSGAGDEVRQTPQTNSWEMLCPVILDHFATKLIADMPGIQISVRVGGRNVYSNSVVILGVDMDSL